ncbi:baseplate assembly protein [Achromobacter marplatensis]|nr:phage baseplate assembly protein V [Achromobacter marplatensis]OWT67703.1 baseplate assembly protein [Achromobacter marplatensis]
MEQAIERLWRRLQMMVGRGVVTSVDDRGPVQMMQVRASGLEVADRRVRPQEFGLSSYPPLGSDAALVSVSGDRSSTIVVGVNHQESRPRDLKPGETKLYSQDGKYVYLTDDGGIVVEAQGQDVVVNNAKNVTWTLSGKLTIVAPGGVELHAPMVKSTGDMQDNFQSNDRTMKGMREVFNDHHHPVRNVQSGGSTVTSDRPGEPQ